MTILRRGTAIVTLLAGFLIVPTLGGAHNAPPRKSKKQKLPHSVRDNDYYNRGEANEARVNLGRNLFYDKVLSGNQNISCATCHHSLTDTGDGLSLPVGEGARGLGVTRNTGVGADEVPGRVPRNAPPVFNLGATEFRNMFHDGRVEVDPSQPSGFRSPAGSDLPAGLENVLAAQAAFPVTSGKEMAGQAGENPVGDAAAAGLLAGPGGVWEQLAARLQVIPAYVAMFIDAFDDVDEASDVTFVHAANAIAAFEAEGWRADESPFDRYLRGERHSLSKSAHRGMQLFYGRAKCSSCHSGAFQTDHKFHAIAMPQIGPGTGDGYSGHEDFGRERVTGDPADRFRFRTPSLRNVALTGPWGHTGAFNSLRLVVEHHADAEHSLMNYDRSQAVLPPRPDLDALDFVVMDSPVLLEEIASRNELKGLSLNEGDVDSLIEFLLALTDPRSLDLRHDVPAEVPSGLPVFE